MDNSDLISRNALLGRMKKVAFENIPVGSQDAVQFACQAMAAVVYTAPAVDAEPVIRCKDCIHRGSSDCPMYVEDEGWCEHCGNEFPAVDRTEDDGFCHLGTITNAED